MVIDPDDAPDLNDLSIEDFEELRERFGLRPQDLDGKTPLRDLIPPTAPSEATTEGRYWLIQVGDHGYEDYISEHDIATAVTEEDLPPTAHESVRELDREALRNRALSGKWNVFLSDSEVDRAWECVKQLVDENVVYRAKVSTKWSREDTGREDYVIVVYTPNYFDTEDVYRVRDALRDHCGINDTVYYKPDLWTKKNIYSETAKEHGLPGASRYSG